MRPCPRTNCTSQVSGFSLDLNVEALSEAVRQFRRQCSAVLPQLPWSRLWCVYEISEAISAHTAVNIAYSMEYVSKHAANLDNMLRARTRDARCAKDSDESYIRDKVEKTGGWNVLDRKIFSFRLEALRSLVKKHRGTLVNTLQNELEKVETVEIQECLAPRDERVASVVVKHPDHFKVEAQVEKQSASQSSDGGFLRKYCSFFTDLLTPPKDQVRPIHIPPPEPCLGPELSQFKHPMFFFWMCIFCQLFVRKVLL